MFVCVYIVLINFIYNLSKLIWKGKQLLKQSFKGNKMRRISLLNFEHHYIAILIKTVYYKNSSHTNWWSRIENPEIDLVKYT